MTPILYSFRRCPYAMRARLALASANTPVHLREVVLRDKPDDFLAASPSGTVPCLIIETGPIDESLDIMKWALGQNDPEGWLDMPGTGYDLITRADGPFKQALDRTKYASRYPDENAANHRAIAAAFLHDLDDTITTWIFDRPTLADYAILPFVRQFAYIDRAWFDAQAWPNLRAWLDAFLISPRFGAIMQKYPQWQPGDVPTDFPVSAQRR
tara:strand:+ start:130252 stop:130887 length:636 start_codon:yes stop_codon:yes gene_type:complete